MREPTKREPGGSRPIVRIAEIAQPEPGESELTLHWTEHEASARITLLVDRLEVELRELEAGDHHDLDHAWSTLSALRGELMGTAEGAEQYRKFEERVDALED